jgi:hypothetical protein
MQVVLAVAAQIGPCVGAMGQNPAAPADSLLYRRRLLGVYDIRTGDPVEGARVTDLVGQITALTTATGTVSLAFLPDGGNLVRIEKVGFRPLTVPVTISRADTVPITLLLTSLTQELPAVAIRDSSPHYLSMALRQFEERRLSHSTGGYYLSEAELQKSPTGRMDNMVRHFPGLSVVCPMRGSKCWANSTRTAGPTSGSAAHCPVAVYLDGAPSTDNDLKKLNVNEYAGVEFYPGGASVPPQYNQTAVTCGVLLFWSRER